MKVALALSFLCGFAALSHEILWYRICSFSTGGAASAFALMLAAYLTGIALGALAAGRLCREREGAAPPLRTVTLLLAASSLAFFVPPLAAALAVRFAPWELTLPLVAAAAALLGAVFPLVSHLAVLPDARSGKRVSFLYFANILGSTAGSLFTGFWLLDRWPLSEVALALALLGLAAAAALALSSERRGSGAVWVAACGAAAALLVASAPTVYDALYEKLQLKDAYVPQEHFAHVVENRSGVITVKDNGTIYGGGVYDGGFNTSLRTDSNGIERAYALAAMHPRPREVLMIGLSSGSWAAVVAGHPAVERLTVVEINPGYLELLPHYPAVSGLTRNPKVSIEIDDGRRWLVRNSARRFDVIVSNTTHNWRANASNLLSAEFFQLVRSRLKPGGVFYFNPTGSMRAARTATDAFPHALGAAGMIA